MKYSLYVILFLSFAGMAQSTNEEHNYLKFVNSQHEVIVKNTWNYLSAAASQLPKYKDYRVKLEKSLKKAIKDVDRKPSPDQEFKLEVINYLNGHLAILDTDFKKLFELTQVGNRPEEEQAIKLQVRKSMMVLRENYDQAVQVYAARYNITAIENSGDLAVKIKETIAVYEYYHQIRIALIPTRNMERTLWENIHEKSLTVLLNEMEAFKKLIKEARDQVNLIGDYNQDGSLKDSALNILAYYNQEVELEMLKVASYKDLNLQENNRTSNQGYNQVINWANEQREITYQHYADTSKVFLNNHVAQLE